MKLTKRQHKTLSAAADIMEELASYSTATWSLTSPNATADYLRVRFAGKSRELFIVVFLNAQNQTIEARVLFTGTVDGASVYPRIVAQEALELNAAAVILAHNHPSGVATPSAADRAITKRIKDALALLDIRVLDHVIFAAKHHFSFAESGII